MYDYVKNKLCLHHSFISGGESSLRKVLKVLNILSLNEIRKSRG